MTEKLNDLYTVKELSQWLRLSKSQVYTLVAEKKIPYFKIGGKLLFDKEKIKNWLEEQSN